MITITTSQQKAAKVAALAYLLTFPIVVYINFAIHDRLIIDNDAVQTAQNILAHEQLFRIGIAGDLIYCAGSIVLLSSLYIVLKPVSSFLSLLAMLWRFIWVLMWIIMTLHFLDALRLITGAPYLQSIGTDKLQGLARRYLGSNFDYYYVGLLFGAMASTLCGYLWLRSRYIPRILSVFGIISSLFGVICTLIFFIFPHFDTIVNLWWFDTPMATFDIITSFWLLFKGLRTNK